MASISNLFVDQGIDFSISIALTDSTNSALNLTGSTFLAQIRKSHGSSTVKGTFTASHDGTGGNLTLSLTDVQTAAIERLVDMFMMYYRQMQVEIKQD